MTSSSAGLYDSLALSSRAEDLSMLPLVGALAEVGLCGWLLWAPSPGDSCGCMAPGQCALSELRWMPKPQQRLQQRLPGLRRSVSTGAVKAATVEAPGEHCTTCAALPSWRQVSQAIECRAGAALTGATGVPGWQRRLVWLCARSAGPNAAARCWLLSCSVSAPDEVPAMALPPALHNH